MTHAAMDAEAQKEAGITPQLIRLSVGIEAKQDLINDLVQALDSLNSLKVASAFCSENETSIELETIATCRLSPALAALW